jgi:hypothetical protein
MTKELQKNKIKDRLCNFSIVLYFSVTNNKYYNKKINKFFYLIDKLKIIISILSENLKYYLIYIFLIKGCITLVKILYYLSIVFLW